MTEPVSLLQCPVRACQRPLVWGERAVVCPAGHVFDRARSGYCNLLQPQDRRAREPGDTAASVAARRRTFDRGLLTHVTDGLGELVSGLALVPGAAVLDVGCGEGGHLAALAARFPIDAWGVDLSRAGIEAAARRYRTPRFVIANADRRLPFADGAFTLVTSITGPKPVAELHRVLAAGARLVLGVSAADDLAELRAALLGSAHDLDRGARMRELFASHFALERELVVRRTAALDRDALADLVATTYRGGRHTERARLDTLDRLDVTLSLRLMLFRPI